MPRHGRFLMTRKCSENAAGIQSLITRALSITALGAMGITAKWHERSVRVKAAQPRQCWVPAAAENRTAAPYTWRLPSGGEKCEADGVVGFGPSGPAVGKCAEVDAFGTDGNWWCVSKKGQVQATCAQPQLRRPPAVQLNLHTPETARSLVAVLFGEHTPQYTCKHGDLNNLTPYTTSCNSRCSQGSRQHRTHVHSFLF